MSVPVCDILRKTPGHQDDCYQDDCYQDDCYQDVIKMCGVPDSVMTTYTGCEEAGARSDTDSGPHSGL